MTEEEGFIEINNIWLRSCRKLAADSKQFISEDAGPLQLAQAANALETELQAHVAAGTVMEWWRDGHRELFMATRAAEKLVLDEMGKFTF